jgi:hypothetical protein
MKRWTLWKSLMIACSLALAAPMAAAQVPHQETEPEYDYDELDDLDGVEEWGEDEVVPREGVVPRGEIERDIARRGMVTGVVTGLDLHHGRVILQTRDGRVLLWANPNQVAGLELGQQFSGRVGMVDQRPWLMEDITAQREELGRYGQTGTFRGTITTVDQGAGTMTVMTPRRETVTMRAHPMQIRQLRQGQRVTLQYQIVGDAIWAQRIGPERMRDRVPRDFDDELEWGAPPQRY